MINIDELIKKAMKEKLPELEVYKEIKAKFLTYTKSPEGVKNPINDEISLQIINKVKKEHEETKSFMKEDNPSYSEEEFAIKTLNSLLPKEATPEEIKEAANGIVIAGDKKCMGMYIKTLKSKFPTADGKVISDIVKELIGC